MGAAQDEPPLFPLKELWRFQVQPREVTGNQTAIFFTPQTDEFRLYFISSNGTCRALFKKTGKVSWVFSIGEPFSHGIFLHGGGPLIVAGAQHTYALDSVSGVPIWRRKNPSELSAPIIGCEGSLFVFDAGGMLYCLNPSDGEPQWQVELPDKVGSTPLVTENKLFCGAEDGSVLCLLTSDGRELWRFSAGGAVRSGFVLDGELLFFGAGDDYAYCVNAANGKQRWKSRAAGNVNGIPTTDRSSVFIASDDRTLRVFKKSNGHARSGSPVSLYAKLDVKPIIINELILFPQQNALVGRSLSQLVYVNRYLAPGDITTSVHYDQDDSTFYFGCRLGQDGLLIAAMPESEYQETTTLQDTPQNRTDEISPGSEAPVPQQDEIETEHEVTESPSEEVKDPPTITEPMSEESDAQQKKEDEDETEVLTEAEEQSPITPGSARSLAILAVHERDLATASEMWRRALRPVADSSYTVTIGLFCRSDSVNSLLDLLSEVEVEDILVFERTTEDSTCYFICVGIFPSREEAVNHMRKMTDEIIQQNPSVFRLDSFVD